MIAKIIVAIVIGIISIVGLTLGLNEISKENKSVSYRAFLGIMITISAVLLTIITFLFAFNI